MRWEWKRLNFKRLSKWTGSWLQRQNDACGNEMSELWSWTSCEQVGCSCGVFSACSCCWACSVFPPTQYQLSVYTLRLSIISAYHRATDKIIALRRRRSSQHVFVPYLLTDGSLGSCGRFKGHEGRGPLRYQTSVSCVVSARLQSYRFCFIASAKDVMFYPQFVCLSVC